MWDSNPSSLFSFSVYFPLFFLVAPLDLKTKKKTCKRKGILFKCFSCCWCWNIGKDPRDICFRHVLKNMFCIFVLYICLSYWLISILNSVIKDKLKKPICSFWWCFPKRNVSSVHFLSQVRTAKMSQNR